MSFGNVELNHAKDGDDKNAAEMVVARGFGSVVRHRSDEERSCVYETLLELEEKAKQVRTTIRVVGCRNTAHAVAKAQCFIVWASVNVRLCTCRSRRRSKDGHNCLPAVTVLRQQLSLWLLLCTACADIGCLQPAYTCCRWDYVSDCRPSAASTATRRSRCLVSTTSACPAAAPAPSSTCPSSSALASCSAWSRMSAVVSGRCCGGAQHTGGGLCCYVVKQTCRMQFEQGIKLYNACLLVSSQDLFCSCSMLLIRG